jgi:hypothetical protein
MLENTHLHNGFYLALVYLVISGNYLGNLFGCRVQLLFRENMWIKHVLGFFTAYFLIVLSTPPEGYDAKQTLLFAGLIYIWFFLTTKMHVRMWIPMILVLLASYGIYVYTKQQTSKGEETAVDKDTTERLQQLQSIATILGVILTLVGVVAYYGEKKIEFEETFDAWKFWSGVPECKFESPTVSIGESLMAAFTGT